MIDAKEFEAMEALFHRVRELPPEKATSEIEAAGLTADARTMLDEMLDADRKDDEGESGDESSSEAHRLLQDAFGGPSDIDWNAAVDAAAQIGETKAGEIGDLPHLLDGRYLLTEILSESIVGVTYRAVDQRTRDKVAVRRIELVRRDGLTPKLRRTELKRLAEIEHPGLERVLDSSGLQGPRPYVVTELCPGESIDDWLANQNPKWELALRVFARACRAVAAAHREHVLHRNLRPGAIIVDPSQPDGDPTPPVVVIDFGLEIGRVGRAADPEATVCAAPELANIGARPSVQSDIYALGALLRWLATGDDSTVVGGARRRWSRGVAVGESGAAPAPLAAIVDKAIAADPVRRHASADDLADDLESYLDALPVRAYLKGPLRHRPLRRWLYTAERRLRRSRTGGAVALAGVALLLLGSLAGWAVLRANAANAAAGAAWVQASGNGTWSEARGAINRAIERDLFGMRATSLHAKAQAALLLDRASLAQAPGPRAQILIPPEHRDLVRQTSAMIERHRAAARDWIRQRESDGEIDLAAPMNDDVRLSIAASLVDLDLYDRASQLLDGVQGRSAAAERVRTIMRLRRAMIEDAQATSNAAAALESLVVGAETDEHERVSAKLGWATYLLAVEQDAQAEATLRSVISAPGASVAQRRFAERLLPSAP